MLTFDSTEPLPFDNFSFYLNTIYNKKKLRPFTLSPFIFNEKYDEGFLWMPGDLHVCDDFAINWIQYEFIFYRKISNYQERKRQC